MGRMIFDLTDEDRAALEAHRVRLGCRSHAGTLRALIRGNISSRRFEDFYPNLADADNSTTTELSPAQIGQRELVKIIPLDVPIFARKAFNPQPKTGKK